MDRKKQDPTICCLLKSYFSLKGTHRLKVKGWKNTFQANGNPTLPPPKKRKQKKQE